MNKIDAIIFYAISPILVYLLALCKKSWRSELFHEFQARNKIDTYIRTIWLVSFLVFALYILFYIATVIFEHKHLRNEPYHDLWIVTLIIYFGGFFSWIIIISTFAHIRQKIKKG